MLSQPALEQPDPQSLIHAISRNICHDGLKILPTTLQQFAHLQLLAARVRSEASRAMTIHLELSDRLESEGVDEYDWCNLGALSQAEGRALRRIIDEGEGRGEEKREDVMMELSMNIRLFVSLTSLYFVVSPLTTAPRVDPAQRRPQWPGNESPPDLLSRSRSAPSAFPKGFQATAEVVCRYTLKPNVFHTRHDPGPSAAYGRQAKNGAGNVGHGEKGFSVCVVPPHRSPAMT